MASISIAGTGSGIDVNSFVTQQQLTAERPSVAQSMVTPTETAQTNLSSQGKLQSAHAAYISTAQKVADERIWANTSTRSSQPAAVSATSDALAFKGTYNVDVNSVATAQATTSASFSGLSTVIGIGTLHIELGSWNSSQTAFSTNPNWPKSDVRLGPRDTSLEKIRDKINAAGVGVVASVISDATGSRLVLRSTSTGADNGFKVSASGEDGKPPSPDLAALGFDPSMAGQQGMSQTQAAADTTAKINGVEVASSSNTVANAVQGVTFKFGKVTDGPAQVTVGIETDAIKKSINDFTQSYNELSALGQAPEGINPQALSDIGINQDANAALQVDQAKLDHTLESQPEQVRATFSALRDKLTLADQSEPAEAPSFAQKLLEQYTALESLEVAAH